MYKSFVLVENLLKNPVLQVFVMLLQSNKKLSFENLDFAMKMITEGLLNMLLYITNDCQTL